jgi:hypothetical protein
MKHRMSKKLTSMITILVILLLMLPAGVLFADSISGGGGKQQPEEIEQPEVEETEESEETEETEEPEETGSENAAAVAARIADAAALGITPGHLNLIDKLYALAEGADQAAFRAEWAAALLAGEKTIQDLNQEMHRLRFLAKGKTFPGDPQNPEEIPELGNQEDEETGHGKALGKGHNK